MLRPITLAAVLLCLAPAAASAQTVRFLTSVGDFYLELNPTDNDNLQGHVDNLLAYVGAGRYHGVVINRAAEGFVLQLGGFLEDGITPDTFNADGFPAVDRFPNVIVDADDDGTVDFDTSGLSNTSGQVSLALSGEPNSGSSPFFLNLDDNSFLDSQSFIPFAQVDDFTTIDRIMGLEQVDLRSVVGVNDPNFQDVPLTEDGDFVILESVMVMDPDFSFEGPLRRVLSLTVDGETISASSTAASSSASASSASAMLLSTTAAPEPGALVLLLASSVAALRRQRG